MAISNCIKCDNTQFELKEFTPTESNFKLQFVQCSRCGGVFGVIDFYNVPELIYRLADKLEISL